MAVEITIKPQRYFQDLAEGLKSPLSSKKRFTATFATGLSAFLLTLFSANPTYSLQMISSGVQNWGIAFTTRFTGLIMNTGYTGLFLTALFSFLVGVTLTNSYIQFRMNRVDFSALGALPGFLAGGCASCGVGVLSLLGFGGVLASLPFQSNLLRFSGVMLLIVLIARTGNPETCKLN